MIDKNSSVPLYHQIMLELKNQIKEEKYQPGQVLPSEAELMRIYGVSRMTVRLAIDGLEKKGYVTKVQGKGTFVRKRKIVQELSMISSWSENLKSQGMETQSRLLQKKEIAADEETAEKLEVQVGHPLYYIERLKLVDGEPLGWGRIWVKKDQFPGLLEQENLAESVYAV
ncbi:MAG: GntR family transcriptional regulator, partial [Christensenellaceae bacterium]|nr:GntR family transcriptional regulator [Christensenellaceae bacterium]